MKLLNFIHFLSHLNNADNMMMSSVLLFIIFFLKFLTFWKYKVVHRALRSSYRRCCIEKAVLKNFAIFTGKHLCWSFFFLIKLQACRPFNSAPLTHFRQVLHLWRKQQFNLPWKSKECNSDMNLVKYIMLFKRISLILSTT